MPKNIGENRVDTTDIARITAEDAKRLSRYLVKPGDIVYSRRGDVERRALIREEENGWLCGTGCLRVRFGKGIVDPLYASYYLGHPIVREWIVRHAIGATMPNLNTSILSSLPFVVPPLDEQKAIAQILSSLDDKIELNQQMNHTLEAIARALFKSWFINFDPVRAKMDGRQPAGMDAETAALFPAEFEDSPLGKLPKGWKVGLMEDEFNITMGQSPPGSTYNEEFDGLPFYQGRRDFGFRYPLVRVHCNAPTRFANVGDTLISVRAPVGDINMASDKCCIGRGVAAARHKGGSRSYTYYTMQELNEHFACFEAEGTVFGSMSKKDFLSIPCIVPSKTIINAFEKLAFSLDQHIENQEQQTLTLTSIRDTLLPKLLSGEIRLKDAEKVLEEVM
jgi:type I restriction enzyme S subunit